MNMGFMISLAVNKLKDFLIEKGGVITLSESTINDYLKNNGHPFRVLFLDDANLGKIIKIVLEKN